MPTDTRRPALPAGVRVIRRVSPPEAPWAGSLVRTEEGVSGQVVDAADLRDWPGWDASPIGHVLGPLDMVRRADGHDVLLPLCTEPVETWIERRGAALPLGDGEAVTLAVSLLRGAAELARRESTATGCWWLTDEGRPVFVDDPTDVDAAGATVDILEHLRGHAGPGMIAAVDRATAAVRDPRVLSHELEDLEQALFDQAAPEPLATAPLASSRRLARAAEAALANDAAAPRPWWSTVLASVDADLSDAFSQATTGLWRRLRQRRPRSRRRMWAIAGSLGVGVVAVGLLWPAPGGPAAADSQPSVSPPATATASAQPVPSTSASAASPPDLAGIASGLLDERLACGTGPDDACLAEVVEDPAREIPSGAVDAAARDRVVTLLDDFGGMAVLRVEAPAAGSAQLVVIVDSAGRWLIRDVHDAMAQP